MLAGCIWWVGCTIHALSEFNAITVQHFVAKPTHHIDCCVTSTEGGKWINYRNNFKIHTTTQQNSQTQHAQAQRCMSDKSNGQSACKEHATATEVSLVRMLPRRLGWGHLIRAIYGRVKRRLRAFILHQRNYTILYAENLCAKEPFRRLGSIVLSRVLAYIVYIVWYFGLYADDKMSQIDQRRGRVSHHRFSIFHDNVIHSKLNGKCVHIQYIVSIYLYCPLYYSVCHKI